MSAQAAASSRAGRCRPCPASVIATDGGALTVRGLSEQLQSDTGGGPAALNVPGGPYALNTDGDGGPVSVHIATSPSATRTLNVSSGGGSLAIAPAGPR